MPVFPRRLIAAWSPLPGPALSPLMARLLVIAAALLFSTGGMGVKSCDLGPWQVASFRSGVAALALVLLLPAARRRWTWRTAAVGVAYAATVTLFVLANKTTTAANAIFLQSTAPIYVLMLAPLLLGERSRRRDLAIMAAMAGALVLVMGGADVRSASAPDPFLGNLLAAASGLSWALTVVGLRWLGRQADGGGALGAVVAGNLFAFLLGLPMALPVVGSLPVDWLWILYLGVVQIALAYALLTTALRALPAFEASLLLLAEPVFNPLWAYWAHAEVPSRGALLGGGVILALTALKSWLDLRRPLSPPPRASTAR